MIKLLLINPRFPESFWSFKYAIDQFLPNKRTVNPPLGLATLAALCPPDWEVEIIDENVESIPLNPRADIVGICGMGVQYTRQKELLTYFKKQEHYVVAGGSYASLCPELYESLADTVIAGEAEYIWKAFCRDYLSGQPRRRYQETGEVDLADSPVPRFDLLKLDKYQALSLQFSRGCPFRCEFCDIIVMFGRKPRTKTPEQVGRELDVLRAHGVRSAFFVDDNLIGHKPLAKELLSYLKSYQEQHHYQFHFGTEASLNMAQDPELLTLFREANFKWVFIGLESPDQASLKETKKLQNTREDMLTSLRKVYAAGLDVFAGFIIGFDNDTPAIFEKQYQFIMKSGIQAAMIGLLTALPKTPLYERLEKEGRLIPENAYRGDNTKLGTNLIPKQMSYQEMVNGYRALYQRLLENRNIADRIKAKARYLTRPLYGREYTLAEALKILRNFFLKGIVPGRFSRWYHFWRSLPLARPQLIPLAIQDWMLGLAMRDYVERHFIQEFEAVQTAARRHVAVIEKVFRQYLQGGSLQISLNQVKNAAADLSISLQGSLDRKFYRKAARHLRKLLRDTAASVTLQIEELQESQLQNLQELLNRLARYGDRITVSIHRSLLQQIKVDSSVFNLILEG